MSPLKAARVLALAALVAAGVAPARASDKSELDSAFFSFYSAQGGLGAATFIQSFEIDETVDFEGQPMPRFALHIVRTRAGHFLFRTTRAGLGTVEQAFDGRVGWQSHSQWGMGLSSNPGADPWVVQNNLLLAMSAFRRGFDYRLLGREDVDGRSCLVAGIKDPGKLEGKIYFDRKNFRILRLERQFFPGSPEQMVAEFGDFQRVSGLDIPFTARVRTGSLTAVHRRTQVTINPHVDESSFVLSTAQLREALEVEAILKRHQDTMGDARAFDRIHSRVTRLVIEVPTSGMKYTETVSQKTPNLILLEINTPGMGSDVRGFDGTTGWVNSELQGYRPLKPPELAELMSEGRAHLVGGLAAGSPFRRRLDERTVNGRAADAVALANQSGPAGNFYFDKETGRLLRIGSAVAGDRTTTTESTMDFSDFRRVDGVEIPFVMTQTTALVRVVSTVQSVENNPPIDDGIFRPRRDY